MWTARPHASPALSRHIGTSTLPIHYSKGTYQKLETEAMWRRAKVPKADVTAPPPPFGAVNGALHHHRRGLVGAFNDWADGSLENVIILLERVAREYGVIEELMARPNGARTETARVDAYIVECFKAALHTLRADNQREQQRRQYETLLCAVAPERQQVGSHKGMILPVASRLGDQCALRTGKRMVKGRSIAFPFERAISARAEFDLMMEAAKRPKEALGVGDDVLCRGQLAKIAWVNHAGQCGITFSVGSTERVVKYNSMLGVGKGSARLLRPAPSLLAPPRAARTGLSEETLLRV
jgi:hypothetical protein